MPILADVEAIASDLSPRTAILSPETLAVLFSVLDAGNRLYDWQGASVNLTDAEMDRIDAYLSRARFELMTGLIGQVISWAGENAPSNFILCDGSVYARDTYPELYEAINGNFHVGASNFAVPDLRAKFIYGSSDLSTIGNTGGESSHVLTELELPSHAHTIPRTFTTLAVEPGEVTVLTPVPILSDLTGYTGGNQPHNNLPPYVRLAYFICAR
jgi:microcystin-dependent protein